MLHILCWLLFWPIILAWKLIGIIFMLTGKLITVAIGLVILIIGFILCLTVIAIPLGVAMIIFAILLMIKGIF